MVSLLPWEGGLLLCRFARFWCRILRFSTFLPSYILLYYRGRWYYADNIYVLWDYYPDVQ